MASLAFSQRIEWVTLGALLARLASHSLPSRLERLIYAVIIGRVGAFDGCPYPCPAVLAIEVLIDGSWESPPGCVLKRPDRDHIFLLFW
jgi:hypothetical protein